MLDPADSPYRKFFNQQILKLQETYVINTLKSKWWKPSKELMEKLDIDVETCSKPEEDHNDLDIKDVGGVFIVLICGCLVAFIVAWCEFLFNVKKVALQEKVGSVKVTEVQVII
jgi:glutamate receptor, ionotropic, invertebrate